MYKVLAIDDSPTMHRLFKMIFSEEDYELKSADTGAMGLELVKEFKPDIILLDFVMPKINGFQFCKILREEMGVKETPILLITSKAEDVGKKFTERFHKVEYIAKPFQPEDLLEKIQKMLNVNGSGAKPITLESVESLLIDKKPSVKSETTIDQIINKIEKSIAPYIRSYIEKYLRLETGYMISDQKGEHLNLPKIIEIIKDGAGEIVIFNESDVCNIYFDNGLILYAWKDENKIEDLFELCQDVFNVCLLEVKTFQELYEQLILLNFQEEMIKRTFVNYLLELLHLALTMEDSLYYVNKMDVPDAFKSKTWVHTDNLEKIYSRFIEEQLLINKLIYDDNLVPVVKKKDNDLLTDFEKRLLNLCDGSNTIGKILSFFGNNKRFVKNALGTLSMSNFLKI
jgi:twitching motility two-component system response regulator PilH